jgi:hypothetical protein
MNKCSGARNFSDSPKKPVVSLLGEAIAYRLFEETIEQLDVRKIKTTPGRYFIDLAKREAVRQGIELGFKRDKE